MAINKHGLPRTIPAHVKAEVRKKCRYGCVMCGSVPYDYDHFLVPWAEASQHNPDDIILLCDKHHRHKTSGLLDAESVKTAIKIRSSENSEFRFKLDATSQKFNIHWPHNNIEASVQGIIVNSKPILQIDVQDDPLEPVLLSGSFSDLSGNTICVIQKNEILSRASSIGDFTLIGNRFIYKTTNGTDSLQFELSPTGILIEKIFHVNGDAFVRSTNEYLLVGNMFSRMQVKNINVIDCEVAIGVQSASDKWDFNTYDFTKLPAATVMESISVIGGHTGIFVDAPSPYKPSFRFG